MLEGRKLISLIMLALFALLIGISFTYAPDTRFLPLVIGVPGLLLCLVQVAAEWRAKHVEPAVTPLEKVRERTMLVWCVVFVLGLVGFGFLYAGPVLVAAYLFFAGKEKWYIAVLAAVFAWAILYGVFGQFLGLPLFDGLVSQYLFG
jgi:hypothetical protein